VTHDYILYKINDLIPSNKVGLKAVLRYRTVRSDRCGYGIFTRDV